MSQQGAITTTAGGAPSASVDKQTVNVSPLEYVRSKISQVIMENEPGSTRTVVKDPRLAETTAGPTSGYPADSYSYKDPSRDTAFPRDGSRDSRSPGCYQYPSRIGQDRFSPRPASRGSSHVTQSDGVTSVTGEMVPRSEKRSLDSDSRRSAADDGRPDDGASHR